MCVWMQRWKVTKHKNNWNNNFTKINSQSYVVERFALHRCNEKEPYCFIYEQLFFLNRLSHVCLSITKSTSSEVRCCHTLSPFVWVKDRSFVNVGAHSRMPDRLTWVCSVVPRLHWVCYCRMPLFLTVRTLLMALMCPRGPIALLNLLERYLLLQTSIFFFYSRMQTSLHSSSQVKISVAGKKTVKINLVS